MSVCQHNITIQRTAANVDVTTMGCSAHGSQHRRTGGGGKGSSFNLQFAHIKSAVCKAVENDAVHTGFCDSEVTTGNGGSVPVKNNSLGDVGETTAVDLQFAAVVILYGIQAAGEAAAVDGERGICCIGSRDISRGSIAAVIVLIAVFNHAGEMTVLCHSNAIVDGHGTVVHDSIIGVSASIFAVLAVFLAAVILAAIKGGSTVIQDRRACVGHIVYKTAAHAVLHGEVAAQGNGNSVASCIIGECLTVQFQQNGLAGGDRDALCHVIQQGDSAGSHRTHCTDGVRDGVVERHLAVRYQTYLAAGSYIVRKVGDVPGDYSVFKGGIHVFQTAVFPNIINRCFSGCFYSDSNLAAGIICGVDILAIRLSCERIHRICFCAALCEAEGYILPFGVLSNICPSLLAYSQDGNIGSNCYVIVGRGNACQGVAGDFDGGMIYSSVLGATTSCSDIDFDGRAAGVDVVTIFSRGIEGAAYGAGRGASAGAGISFHAVLRHYNILAAVLLCCVSGGAIIFHVGSEGAAGDGHNGFARATVSTGTIAVYINTAGNCVFRGILDTHSRNLIRIAGTQPVHQIQRNQIFIRSTDVDIF